MAENTPQLLALCVHHGINHLVYCGFAVDWCLLMSPGGMLEITRHGDTIGYYLPTRRKRTEAQKKALEEAAARVHEDMIAAGVTEDEIIEDFKRLRREGRK